ncbi:RNA guanine-N7 methyltransferase activating subunit-like [Brienomyrus brachyistius]|uniref:RNA guanine-N7 methyltransferase activating subunit-like n=1 Tax=Brienomyrus brachyistius TaxID=42636 RepID=UPI0020B36559|nr:RNA guanine-N7 methyltransferase activating subunit-like [Brienomyrus brachyistius]XP_048829114.1 RNA guanine-N7 methyltransferase activating subunit-like [Brienomyrus brachyistius]
MSAFPESSSDLEERFSGPFASKDGQQNLGRDSYPPPTAEDWSGLGAGDNQTSGSPEPVPDYEEQFAHRFTSADQEYQEYLKRPSNPPPIVEEWRGRGGGHHNRYHEQRPYRGHDGGRGWSGNQWGSQQWQDRRWSHGSGRDNPHSGHHNSYNQRPPNNRY